jgi:hypothetical protein
MQYRVGACLQAPPSSVALQWRSLGRVQPVSIATAHSALYDDCLFILDTLQLSLHSIVRRMYNLSIYTTVAILAQV